MSTATAVATGHHASSAAACTEVKAYRSGQTRVVADVEVGPQTRGSLAAAAGRVPARSVWPTPPGLGGRAWARRGQPVRRPRRVVIVSASVGAGHDGAAQEMARRLGAAGFAVDRYDFVDLLPARLGRLLRAGYRRQLNLAPGSWPWLLAVLEHHPWAARGAAGVAATAGGGCARRSAATARRWCPPIRWPARRWAGCADAGS